VYLTLNYIDSVMVSVFPWSVVDRGFSPQSSGQTKNYRMCICSFSAMHASLTNKSKSG